MKNKIILFDIDHTLFDTNLFRQLVAERLHRKLPSMTMSQIMEADNAAHKKMKNTNTFSPVNAANFFSLEINSQISPDEIVDIWTDKQMFQSCLYDDVLPVLRKLQNEGFVMGVFSTGIAEFQIEKIAALQSFFQKEHIHIFELKDIKLQVIIGKYKDDKMILVDDSLFILKQAKEIDQNVMVIWIRRDAITAGQHIEGFDPDKTIQSFIAFPEIVA